MALLVEKFLHVLIMQLQY